MTRKRFTPWSPVSAAYGAPMGRVSRPNGFEPTATLAVAGPAGEYDAGGAYWGLGVKDGPVWAVWERGNGREGVVYVRAWDREQAKDKATEV